MISIEEGVGKMRAALAAREDKALTIIGRTSAAAINGLADGIKRLKAYETAGVDALFIAGGLTRHDLDAIADEVKIPLMLGGVSRRPAGQGIPGQPRRADCPAGPPAVLRRGQGDLRHAEGPA